MNGETETYIACNQFSCGGFVGLVDRLISGDVVGAFDKQRIEATFEIAYSFRAFDCNCVVIMSIELTY